MRLEIESIKIKDIQADKRTYAENGVLHVDLSELERVTP